MFPAKSKIVITAILICSCALFFMLGYCYAKREIVSYKKDGYIEVYPYNWPTYNLPLVEYSSLLNSLKHGDTEEAKMRLESFLDRAIKDAQYRMSVATPSQQENIRKSLDKALDVIGTKTPHPEIKQ